MRFCVQVRSMAGKCKLSGLNLTVEEKERLDSLRHSRSEPVRKVERANILWHYHAGLNPSEIKKTANVSRVTVYNCLRKALAMGMKLDSKMLFIAPKNRSSAAPTKPGSCIWPAPNPKISVTP